MNTSSSRHIILGMAGHIDHGKTEIVKALTGTDTDRLKEEKERGMTTDLGFAFLGNDITIIDVPGHEKFVKTMVAGVNTVDLAVLVIAADDGIMPQTVEHLEILNLLNVPTGLVALSKIDLVEKDWVELVKEDIIRVLKGTVLEGVPIVPVSPITGEGIEPLKNTILLKSREVKDRQDKGVFRLPIDRVFTIKGFGTVVAGTILSGDIAPEDSVELLPQGLTLRVRGVQVHDKPVTRSRIGFRTAINLIGIEKEAIIRGDVLAEPGYFRPTQMMDADFTLLSSGKKELKNRARVRIHIGTSEIIGRIVLLDKASYSPGDKGFVQLHLEKPVAADVGDRFVIRSYSPVHTIGGGTLLDVNPPKHKRFQQEILDRLNRIARGDPEQLVAEQLFRCRFNPASPEELSRMLGMKADDVKQRLESLSSQERVLCFLRDKWVSATHFKRLKEEIAESLSKYHEANPLRQGLSRAELRNQIRSNVDRNLLDHSINMLLDEGILHGKGDRFRLATHKTELSPVLTDLKKQIESLMLIKPFAPPGAREISSQLGKQSDAVIAFMLESGELVRIEEGLLLHRKAIEQAGDKIRAYLQSAQKATVSDLKSHLGTTRKYAVPLLTYFDNQGLTERDGDFRKLRE